MFRLGVKFLANLELLLDEGDKLLGSLVLEQRSLDLAHEQMFI